jgi:hypothetical protein
MMTEFVASMYHIMRAGRHVAGGLFNSADEIFDRVRCQRAGVYSVHRHHPSEHGLGHETAFWGEVAHFGAGKISFDPGPSRL